MDGLGKKGGSELKNKIILLVIIIFVIALMILGCLYMTRNKFQNENQNINYSIYNENEEIILENMVVDLTSGNYPKMIESLIEIPLPDYIIFYHNEKEVKFEKNTYEYKKIISINNKRNTDNLGATKGLIDIEYQKSKNDVLAYFYEDDGAIYFSLFDDLYIKENNKSSNRMWSLYDKNVFYSYEYIGIGSAQELIDYLYSTLNND